MSRKFSWVILISLLMIAFTIALLSNEQKYENIEQRLDEAEERIENIEANLGYEIETKLEIKGRL